MNSRVPSAIALSDSKGTFHHRTKLFKLKPSFHIIVTIVWIAKDSSIPAISQKHTQTSLAMVTIRSVGIDRALFCSSDPPVIAMIRMAEVVPRDPNDNNDYIGTGLNSSLERVEKLHESKAACTWLTRSLSADDDKNGSAPRNFLILNAVVYRTRMIFYPTTNQNKHPLMLPSNRYG